MADPQPWPPLAITLTDEGAIIAEAGVPSRTVAIGPSVYRDAIDECVSIARHYRRALPVTASGPEGTFHLMVTTDGKVTDLTGTKHESEPPTIKTEDSVLEDLEFRPPVLPLVPKIATVFPPQLEELAAANLATRHQREDLSRERWRLASVLSQERTDHAKALCEIHGRERVAAARISAIHTRLESLPDPNDITDLQEQLRRAHRERDAIRAERETLTNDFSHLESDLTARITIIDQIAPDRLREDPPSPTMRGIERSTPVPTAAPETTRHPMQVWQKWVLRTTAVIALTAASTAIVTLAGEVTLPPPPASNATLEVGGQDPPQVSEATSPGALTKR